jgi:hypothetical protein
MNVVTKYRLLSIWLNKTYSETNKIFPVDFGSSEKEEEELAEEEHDADPEGDNHDGTRPPITEDGLVENCWMFHQLQKICLLFRQLIQKYKNINHGTIGLAPKNMSIEIRGERISLHVPYINHQVLPDHD